MARAADHPPIDTTRPNVARMYDYWLGGKDNFAADRQLAERMAAIDAPCPGGPGTLPNLGIAARARDNRAFVVKAVTRAAAEGGITQFLDLGAGLPAAPSVHAAARAVRPGARVCYVDSDEVALLHLESLLAVGEGLAASGADLTDPGAVLADPDVTRVIDLRRPLGVILAGVAHFYPAAQVRDIASAYMAAAAPGSWLIVSAARYEDEALLGRLLEIYTAASFRNHGPGEFASFLTGLEMVPPGTAGARRWIRGIAGGLPHRAAYMLCGAGVRR